MDTGSRQDVWLAGHLLSIGDKLDALEAPETVFTIPPTLVVRQPPSHPLCLLTFQFKGKLDFYCLAVMIDPALPAYLENKLPFKRVIVSFYFFPLTRLNITCRTTVVPIPAGASPRRSGTTGRSFRLSRTRPAPLSPAAATKSRRSSRFRSANSKNWTTARPTGRTQSILSRSPSASPRSATSFSISALLSLSSLAWHSW